MKKLLLKLKAALRPLLGPVWRRVAPRIRRVTGTRRELDELKAGWHQHLPALINAAASVAAVAREQARMKREHEAAVAELQAQITELRAEITRLRGERAEAADRAAAK